jgi:hypothetical protein
MGDGPGCLEKGADLLGNRRFESTSLQGRVCEPSVPESPRLRSPAAGAGAPVFTSRIVIYGYLSGLSRPEQVVHFFRRVVGVPVVGKEILSQRTADYQNWADAFAR